MCSLTKELILSKSKGKSLESVKKLNCWASGLNEISILKELSNLQVLTLSVNQITTLKDIAGCTELKELYIRENQISDLDEIFYLKNLKNLKILWLADNDCCKNTKSESDYRLTVIRNLSNLQKLDNFNVTRDEVENALRYGREILEAPSAENIHTKSTDINTYNNLLPLEINSNEAELDSKKDLNKTSCNRKLDEIENFITDEFLDNPDYENNLTDRHFDMRAKSDSIKSTHTSSSGDLRSEFSSQPSNTLSAILILLNDLNEFQLQTVLEACLAKKQKSISSINF